MKFISILFCAFLAFSAPVLHPQAKHVSGQLVFADGTTLDFKNIVAITGYSGRSTLPNKFPVYFENTKRFLSYDNLLRIEVLDGTVSARGARGPNLLSALVEVTTITGVTVETSVDALWSVNILIDDKLTGEQRRQEVRFANERAINIKAISFANKPL